MRPGSKAASPRRSGLTTVEVVVALLLLGVAAAGVGRSASLFRESYRALDLGERIHIEMINARETIASWNDDKLQVSQITDLPISAAIHRSMPDAHWEAEIVELTAPISAKRVRIALVGTYSGQAASPSQLTFWIADH